MSYTLQEFRDLVRATLDLDETDLTDLLVDEWVRDGATRAQSKRQEWPFFSDTWTFNAVAADDTYTLQEITTATGNGFDIAEIRQVRGQSWDLQWQDIHDKDLHSTQSSPRTGTPTHWSQWENGDLVLWPQPTATETHQIRGFREPKDWVRDGAAGESDMPMAFDSPILNWAIGRAYAQQDEPATALYYADMADLRLDELVARYDDPSPALNVTMGGERPKGLMTDPRIPWE